MDGVERCQLGWHRLRRAPEHDGVYVDQFERTGVLQNRRPALREIVVVETDAKPKTIQSSQTFSNDERTGNTAANSRPLPQSVPLVERQPKKHRRVDVRGHL